MNLESVAAQRAATPQCSRQAGLGVGTRGRRAGGETGCYPYENVARTPMFRRAKRTLTVMKSNGVKPNEICLKARISQWN